MYYGNYYLCIPKFSKILNCSNYDNPCEFLSAFETSGTCPAQLAANGLPCTCPFNPSTINLPPSLFHVTHLNTAWSILATVSVWFTWIAIHNDKPASPNIWAFFLFREDFV